MSQAMQETVKNSIEKMVGSNNTFGKQIKYCEFCGTELEQVRFELNGVLRYVPAYKTCECEQAKVVKEKENELKRQQIAEEEQCKREERKKEKIKNLFGNSGMSQRALNCSFDNYQPSFQNAEALKVCNEYIKDFDLITRSERNGLFICGECGVGKSHIAFATANELIKKGNSVIAMTMIDLLLKIKSSYGYGVDNGSEERILKVYEDCSLLIIDDLGKEKPTDWVLQMIYSIVDRRYNALKPIIVTTNFTASELIKRFGDSSIGNAIVDRLFETCQYVPIGGESYRKRKG